MLSEAGLRSATFGTHVTLTPALTLSRLAELTARLEKHLRSPKRRSSISATTPAKSPAKSPQVTPRHRSVRTPPIYDSFDSGRAAHREWSSPALWSLPPLPWALFSWLLFFLTCLSLLSVLPALLCCVSHASAHAAPNFRCPLVLAQIENCLCHHFANCNARRLLEDKKILDAFDMYNCRHVLAHQQYCCESLKGRRDRHVTSLSLTRDGSETAANTHLHATAQTMTVTTECVDDT